MGLTSKPRMCLVESYLHKILWIASEMDLAFISYVIFYHFQYIVFPIFPWLHFLCFYVNIAHRLPTSFGAGQLRFR